MAGLGHGAPCCLCLLLLLLLQPPPPLARPEDASRANSDPYNLLEPQQPQVPRGCGGRPWGLHGGVSINDCLDIYCPRYGAPLPPAERMEHCVLYIVKGEDHASCDHRQRGFKRWECNRPAAPGGRSSSPRSSSSSRPSRWASSSARATSITTCLPHHPVPLTGPAFG